MYLLLINTYLLIAYDHRGLYNNLFFLTFYLISTKFSLFILLLIYFKINLFRKFLTMFQSDFIIRSPVDLINAGPMLLTRRASRT